MSPTPQQPGAQQTGILTKTYCYSDSAVAIILAQAAVTLRCTSLKLFDIIS